MPRSGGGIEWADLLGVELMAADTVSFHYINPALFNPEEPGPAPAISDDPKVVWLTNVAARVSTDSRFRHHDPNIQHEPGRPVFITVTLRRD